MKITIELSTKEVSELLNGNFTTSTLNNIIKKSEVLKTNISSPETIVKDHKDNISTTKKSNTGFVSFDEL